MKKLYLVKADLWTYFHNSHFHHIYKSFPFQFCTLTQCINGIYLTFISSWPPKDSWVLGTVERWSPIFANWGRLNKAGLSLMTDCCCDTSCDVVLHKLHKSQIRQFYGAEKYVLKSARTVWMKNALQQTRRGPMALIPQGPSASHWQKEKEVLNPANCWNISTSKAKDFTNVYV